MNGREHCAYGPRFHTIFFSYVYGKIHWPINRANGLKTEASWHHRQTYLRHPGLVHQISWEHTLDKNASKGLLQIVWAHSHRVSVCVCLCMLQGLWRRAVWLFSSKGEPQWGGGHSVYQAGPTWSAVPPLQEDCTFWSKGKRASPVLHILNCICFLWNS